MQYKHKYIIWSFICCSRCSPLHKINWMAFVYRILPLDLCYMISRWRFEATIFTTKKKNKKKILANTIKRLNSTQQASIESKMNGFSMLQNATCVRGNRKNHEVWRDSDMSRTYTINSFDISTEWHNTSAQCETQTHTHTYTTLRMWNERKRKEPMLIKTLFHVLTCRPKRVSYVSCICVSS